jgi:hypothetical protein
MPRILQTDASVWKEATLSFSHTVTPWDSVWTGELDGTLPTYLITDTWKPSFSQCALVLWTAWTGSPQNEKNLLHLRTIHETYHVNPWDGTVAHAVQLLAELLRYKCIYDPEGKLVETTIPITKIPPRPLILITEEEKYSLEKNQHNRCISQILFIKDPTFSDIFSLCKTLPSSYVIFTRPGVVLDDFRDLWSFSMEKKVLALLSHEVPSSGSLEGDTLPPISDIQDSWVMRSEDAAALEGPQFDIPLTQPKAECAFAYYMLREKFLVVNPARSLVTWTLTRGTLEGQEAEADSPVYHFIHPTGINPMKPLIAIDQDTFRIEQTVEGPDATRWMHTLSKKGIAMTLGKSQITLTAPKPFTVANCFQTSTGLAFDSSTMYIGNGKGAQEAWTNIEALVPTVKYDAGTIAPVDSSPIFQVAKLLLSSKSFQGVYSVSEGCGQLFRRFGLTATIPPAPRIFYKSALVYPFDSEITPPMVAALRKAVSWSPTTISHDGRPSLICADATFEEALRPAWDVRIITPQDSFDRILDNLKGAWGMIYDPCLCDYMWMLPLGARVFELSSQETKAHRLSTVAGLRHIFTTKAKLLNTIADIS